MIDTYPARRQRWLNIGCGPHLASRPWWNVDVVRAGRTVPDEVVSSLKLPYEDESVERIYAGHIIEHMPLVVLPRVLSEWRRVLVRDGQLVVVGPDCNRALDLYNDGELSKQELWDRLEHSHASDDPEGVRGRHWWNCTPERTLRVLEEGGFPTAEEVPLQDLVGDWPITSLVEDQFAVVARKEN